MVEQIQNSIYSREFNEAEKLLAEFKYNEALEKYLNILKKTFDFVEIWEDIAECHFWKKEDEKCIPLLDIAMKKEITPNNWYLRGMCRSEAGSFEGACHCFKMAIRSCKKIQPEAIRRLGFNHCLAGRLEVGLSLLERANILNPNNIETLLDMVAVCLDLNQIIPAKKYWFLASRINPNDKDLINYAKEINKIDVNNKTTKSA